MPPRRRQPSAPWRAVLLTLFWWFLVTRTSLSLPIFRRAIARAPEDREFTERGFRADGPITSALVEWSAVTRVEERAGVLLVYVGREVHGTPLRAFAAEQRAAVAELLRRQSVLSASMGSTLLALRAGT